MRSVNLILVFIFLLPNVLKAQVTDEMFTKFNSLKMDILAMDIKTKSANDSVYIRKVSDLEEAYRKINDAYWKLPEKKVTSELGQKTTQAALALVYFKIPLDIIKNNANFDSCYDAWRELQSLEKGDANLYENFKAVLKSRCKTESLPEN